MIDLHCHLLPGIDDGPPTIEDSLALARAAVQTGTREIVATPHVSWRFDNDAATIAQVVDSLNERLRTEAIPLIVHAGAEIALTRVRELPAEELAGLTLGAGPWLMIESPLNPSSAGLGLEGMLLELQQSGRQIVLAHPERCPAFQRDPALLDRLVRSGMVTSVTAGALVGRFGRTVSRFAQRLAEEGLIHNVASDAHDHARRPPGMGAELEKAGLGQLTDWLTGEVPRAILAGRRLPGRPDVELPRVQRRWWQRRRS